MESYDSPRRSRKAWSLSENRTGGEPSIPGGMSASRGAPPPSGEGKGGTETFLLGDGGRDAASLGASAAQRWMLKRPVWG